MSNKTYNDLLCETSDLIAETTQADEAVFAAGSADREALQPLLLELRVRYTLLLDKLDTTYDQLIQPQKRLVVKKLLEACLGRLIEIKHDIVEIQMLDYTFDNVQILEKLKVTPDQAEPRVPQFFIRDRESDVNGKRVFIENTLRKLGHEPTKPETIVLTEQQAILIIQSHERARQGRLRGQFMKEIRLLKEKGRDQKGEMSPAAATAIQRVWRGYLARRETKLRKNKEMLLIGMERPIYKESENMKHAEEVKEYRRNLVKEREKEYKEALVSIERYLRSKQEVKIKEQIGDELRSWISEYYVKSGKLPEFPAEESGGSRAMFSRQGADSELSKSSPTGSSKESKKSKESKDKKSSKTEDNKVKVDEMEDIQNYACNASVFLQEVISANEEFEDIWKDKDESENHSERFEKGMIERDHIMKIEGEIRNTVDDVIRNELELLQAAYDKDRAFKGKKAKKAQKKVRRGGKKSKKKKEKDLTPDRTTESLFEELVANGIIRPYHLTKIDDFVGEKCYISDDLKAAGKDPAPCLGDTRQLVKEYCILPLGSEQVRANAPIIKSVLLTGPTGSGKRMLIHSICSELGAVLFDLSPANIVGKYPGKTGLIMLIHLVTKVSRLLQPSVIWMDDAEKPFVKKIPKTDKTDPKRLKKDLIKIIKAIYPEDRVIFIGTSRSPWEAEQKLLFQCYSKVIQIPKADYGSLALMWMSRLHRVGALAPGLNVSCLTRVCDSYTIGTLLAALNAVLTTKRSLQLLVRPLTAQEIAVQLSTREPVYAEQESSAETWWSKTPMERKRQRMLQRLEELRVEAEEKANSGK